MAEELGALGYELVEPECGELVTSLDMVGLSLTLFWPTDELEALWGDPADSAAYRKARRTPGIARMLPPSEISSPTVMDSGASSPGERAAALVVLAALERAARVILGNVDRLGLIDAAAGDGDHGVGMRRGIEAAVEAFRGGVLAGTGVAEDLELAGRSWADTAGEHPARSGAPHSKLLGAPSTV